MSKKSLIICITSLFIVSCASSQKKSQEIFDRYFKLVDRNDKKASFQLLFKNLPTGSDSSGFYVSHGYILQKSNKNIWVLDGKMGDMKQRVKDFINTTFIVKECSSKVNTKTCFFEEHKKKFSSKFKDNNYHQDYAKTDLKNICSIPCPSYSSMCETLASDIGQSWKSGQRFLDNACGE